MAPQSLFESFWKQFPRKVAKKDAQKAWKTLRLDLEFDAVCALLQMRISEDWRKRSKEHIPYPAHFLRSESFELVEAIEDDVENPPLFRYAGIHLHHCAGFKCPEPHDWLHSDGLCYMSVDVICEEGLARLKARAK